MALSSLLVDTYRKYKKGTENVVQWLAETARSTGAVEDLFRDGAQDAVPATGGRLKGKARKAAKMSGSTTRTSTFRVPIRSFTTLAKAIANAAGLEVPGSFFTTIRAVIRGRKECARWYLMNQEDANDVMEENNKGHQHFIETLENVLDVLQAKQLKMKLPTFQNNVPNTRKVTNIFECLKLEEPISSEDIPDTIVMSKIASKVDYKLETSDAEISFALYCFLKDATHIRLFVRRTWREFKRGEIKLQTAAFTMNAAIGMIEKLSNDFQEAFPQFQDTDKNSMHISILLFIYRGYCTDKKGEPFLLCDTKEEEGDLFTYKEGGQILQSSTVMCTHTTELFMRYFTKPDAKALRISKDEKRLLKCLSQLAAMPLGSVKGGEPYKGDFVHKAAWKMIYDQRLETWMIFAIQIFWDTQRELGALLPVAQQLLEETARELVQCYTTYLDTKGLDKVGEAHKRLRSDIMDRKNHIKALILDGEFQAWIDKCENCTTWKFPGGPDFSLLAAHPSLCGLIQLNIRNDHHRIFTNMAGDQGQILVTAHLYNAAHSSGLLPTTARWADLDWFIEQHGSDWIYVGKKPQAFPDMMRRLSLAMGLGISKFAKDHRNPRSGNGSNGRFTIVGMNRRLEYLARYSELSVERLGNKIKKYSGESRASKEVMVMADALARDFLGTEKSSTPLSMLDTLSATKCAIEKDDAAFNFDVMDLYLRCIQLLRRIQSHCLDHAPLDFPDSTYNKGLGMNAVINEMLHHCAGLPHHHPLVFPAAVHMMADVITKEGDATLAKANSQEDKLKIPQLEPEAEAEPSFENPYEDMMSFEWRNMASMIVFQDENGDCRMPFDMPIERS
jgi:hypothetical protein